MRVTEAEYQAMVSRNTPQAPKPARNKYCAVKTTVDGITFASGHEADCWLELKVREQHGWITGLRRQVPFAIVIDGLHVCDYVADFVWMEGAARVVADAKGYKNPVYRLKRKLMQAVNQIEIREL